MAVQDYGLNRGQEIADVTEAVGSPIAQDVVVSIDLDQISSEEEARLLATKILDYILQNAWPA